MLLVGFQQQALYVFAIGNIDLFKLWREAGKLLSDGACKVVCSS